VTEIKAGGSLIQKSRQHPVRQEQISDGILFKEKSAEREIPF